MMPMNTVEKSLESRGTTRVQGHDFGQDGARSEMAFGVCHGYGALHDACFDRASCSSDA